MAITDDLTITDVPINNSIDAMMSRMLEPAGLDEKNLSATLGSMMQGGVDYADLYFQVSRHESWTLEDGIIREGSFSLDQGVGVRASSGEKTGFAYSDELLLPALQQAAGAAKAIARQGQDLRVQAWNRRTVAPLYTADDPTTSIDDAQKTALLTEIDALTRELDSRVEQVIVSLASSQDLVLLAASDGTMAADVRPLGAAECKRHIAGERSSRAGLLRGWCSLKPQLFYWRRPADGFRTRGRPTGNRAARGKGSARRDNADSSWPRLARNFAA